MSSVVIHSLPLCEEESFLVRPQGCGVDDKRMYRTVEQSEADRPGRLGWE